MSEELEAAPCAEDRTLVLDGAAQSRDYLLLLLRLSAVESDRLRILAQPHERVAQVRLHSPAPVRSRGQSPAISADISRNLGLASRRSCSAFCPTSALPSLTVVRVPTPVRDSRVTEWALPPA